MTQIKANIALQHYKVTIQSPSGNTLIADEPVANGGGNLGFNPHELLAAALSACTAATVRMYADHKGWDLQSLDVMIKINDSDESGKTMIERELNCSGNLDEAQKQRLLVVANKCPIHKLLTHSIKVETILK